MPNVTLYISAQQMPAADRLAELSADCIALCTGILQASLKNVHVIHVAALHGYGHPVFAQVLYRLETFRTPAVMDEFAAALDRAIVRSTGLTARIRCFAYAPADIYDRN